ncbi:hypothetical protein SCA6_011911 [Theobroma cacao]
MRFRMKGGPYRLRWRGKELSLILIVLVCATILVWTWDRSPVLTSSLPSKNQLLQLSPEERQATFLSVSRIEIKFVNIAVANVLEYFNEEETEKHKYSPKREKTGVVKSGSSSTQIEETNNVILGEKASEQEDKKVENQACNYAKGKWVIDDRRPLYSGFGCKQWLAPMWACRLMQRQDFAFEKLRWQPKDCEMEEFEGSKFFKRMQDKTLAFVGDSLGRQQFQSLMCMITAGKDSPNVQDVGKEYGLVIPPGGKRPNGWAYRFPSTNTTVLYYWSASLCDLEPLNVRDPHTEYAMHLDRPPAFLRQFLHKIDVLVLNTGHHWNRGKLKANRWVMYVGGVPNNNRKIADMGGAKNFTIHSTIKWINSQLPKHPHLKAFYRSISPRHFVNGDWNTGGSCDNTSPMSIGKEVLQEESSDYSAASAVRGTGVELLDVTALSQHALRRKSGASA